MKNADVTEPAPVIFLSGELDLTDAPWCEKQIERARGEHHSVTVNARDLTYLDSSILVMLLRQHRICLQRSGRLCVVEPSPRLARVLNVTGVDRILCPLGSLGKSA